MLGAAAGGWTGPAVAQTPIKAAQRNFDIPAQPLVDAIIAYGAQSGLEVTASAALLSGRSGGAVRGSFAPTEGLSRLLTGTGLTFRFLRANVVVLEPVPAAADGAVQLGPVRIEGGSDAGGSALASTSDPVASEGTRSYAAQGTTISRGTKTLREIPQSVTVITRQRIEDQNFTTLDDAMRYSPAVTGYGNEQGTSADYQARGFVLRRQYDGVSLGTADYSALDFDIEIYDRVEILRGPNGLLQGANSAGGSINLVRKRPQKEFALSGMGSVGSWNNYRGAIDIGGPLVESGAIRARTAFIGYDRDFYYKRADAHQLTGYGIVEADVTPTTTLGLSVAHQRLDRVPYYGTVGYADGGRPDLPRSYQLGADWARSEARLDEYVADLTQRIGEHWTLRGSGRVRDSHLDVRAVRFNGGINRATNTISYFANSSVSSQNGKAIDVNLDGKFLLFGRVHNLTLGYTREYFRSESTSVTGAPAVVLPLGTTPPISIIPDYNYFYVGRVRSSAFYGSTNLELLRNLHAIVGGRVTNYNASSRTGLPVVGPWVQGNRVSGYVTPYAGVTWDVSRKVTLYASYTDSFAPTTTQDYLGKVLEPTVGWQLESGIKAALFEDQLNLSAAIYQSEQRNVIIRDPDPTHICPGSTGACSINGPSTYRKWGLEFEANGSPLPGLQLSASYAWHHDDGTWFEIYAKKKATFWATYQQHPGQRGWMVGGGLTAQGATSDAYGGDSYRLRQGAFVVADFQMGYRFSEHVQAALNVNNIFDRTYLRQINFLTGAHNLWGDPRNITLSVRAKY